MSENILNQFSLEGKVAWVTGASYGIGFAMASAYARAGARIAFNDINQELVDKGLAAYKAAGIEVKGYVCDVTDEEAVQATTAQIEKELGPIDILVNNAGIIRRIPMHEMDPAEWRKVIEVDLTAPFIVAKAVLPSMMERRSGKIINICSVMSEISRPTIANYAASKGGLKMLTRAMAVEWGRHNIQVNGIGPGYIATELNRPLLEDEKFNSWICGRTPLGRWGKPDDVAGAAVFLASPAADFITGQIIYVDGGILAAL